MYELIDVILMFIIMAAVVAALLFANALPPSNRKGRAADRETPSSKS